MIGEEYTFGRLILRNKKLCSFVKEHWEQVYRDFIVLKICKIKPKHRLRRIAKDEIKSILSSLYKGLREKKYFRDIEANLSSFYYFHKLSKLYKPETSLVTSGSQFYQFLKLLIPLYLEGKTACENGNIDNTLTEIAESIMSAIRYLNLNEKDTSVETKEEKVKGEQKTCGVSETLDNLKRALEVYRFLRGKQDRFYTLATKCVIELEKLEKSDKTRKEQQHNI